MQLTSFLPPVALLLLPTLTLGAPAPHSRPKRQAASDQQLRDAANAWLADTQAVSNFLSIAATLSGQDLRNQASTAFQRENDEANPQKMTIDGVLLNTGLPESGDVGTADDVLVTQGTFQFVVDGLSDLALNGDAFDQATIASKVDAINNDRCGSVLPAIDMYFQAVEDFVQDGIALTAARPTQCQ